MVCTWDPSTQRLGKDTPRSSQPGSTGDPCLNTTYIEDAGCLLCVGVVAILVQKVAAEGVSWQHLPQVRIPFDRSGQRRAEPSSRPTEQTNKQTKAGCGMYLIWQNSCLVYQKHWVPYPVTLTVVEVGAFKSQDHLLKVHRRPCPKLVVRCLAQPTYCVHSHRTAVRE